MSKNSNQRRKQQGGEGPELRLIGGSAEGARIPSDAGDACEDAVRDGVVARARDRVASGYYRRSDVIERLVELLWDELYTH